MGRGGQRPVPAAWAVAAAAAWLLLAAVQQFGDPLGRAAGLVVGFRVEWCGRSSSSTIGRAAVLFWIAGQAARPEASRLPLIAAELQQPLPVCLQQCAWVRTSFFPFASCADKGVVLVVSVRRSSN